jgi:hypothetical protein
VGQKKLHRKLARQVINGKLSVTQARAKLDARRQQKKAVKSANPVITKAQVSRWMAADAMTGMLQSDNPAEREMASRYLEVRRVTANPDYWRAKAERLEAEKKNNLIPRQDSLAC